MFLGLHLHKVVGLPSWSLVPIRNRIVWSIVYDYPGVSCVIDLSVSMHRVVVH